MADLSITKLIINGQSYAIPDASATQKGFMSSDDYTKLAGIATGAEVNKIDEIKINGAAVAIAAKAVNLLFAQGEQNGSIKLGDAEVLVKGLAALAFKENVTKDDLESTLKALVEKIPTLETGLQTLNGDKNTAGSVKKMIEDKFDEWTKAVTADNETVDTFKELVDWVAEHGSDAAEYAKSISALEAMLEGIGGTSEPATVMAAIQAADKFDPDLYYTKEDIDASTGYVKKEAGKGLSQENFTSDLLAKLNGIAAGANKVTYSYDAATQALSLNGLSEA